VYNVSQFDTFSFCILAESVVMWSLSCCSYCCCCCSRCRCWCWVQCFDQVNFIAHWHSYSWLTPMAATFIELFMRSQIYFYVLPVLVVVLLVVAVVSLLYTVSSFFGLYPCLVGVIKPPQWLIKMATRSAKFASLLYLCVYVSVCLCLCMCLGRQMFVLDAKLVDFSHEY